MEPAVCPDRSTTALVQVTVAATARKRTDLARRGGFQIDMGKASHGIDRVTRRNEFSQDANILRSAAVSDNKDQDVDKRGTGIVPY
jgi:hypothetical protein